MGSGGGKGCLKIWRGWNVGCRESRWGGKGFTEMSAEAIGWRESAAVNHWPTNFFGN